MIGYHHSHITHHVSHFHTLQYMNPAAILCVDDEEIVLRSLQRELNEMLGQEYIIETAEGGDDALELFQELCEEGYDVPVVISDHIMPGMKGDELLQRIHSLSPKTGSTRESAARW